MTIQTEKLEHSLAKITVTVPAEDFKKAVTAAYNKEKGKYPVQGFRKGKAPQNMIEKFYGSYVFYETAANSLVDSTYTQAVNESGLDVVSKPEIEGVQLESGKDFIYSITVAVRPEVTLGEYKGLEAKKVEAEVSDEEVAAAIAKEQQANARMISVDDRAAQMGDITKINFAGSVDGVEFPGGKGEDYPLELGSGSFIPGFEEQIVGHSVGESFDVNVTFPEDYTPELAGKAAVFAVTINSMQVKELPELDDDFASEISDFDTFEEYKESVKKSLLENKEKDAAYQTEENVVNALAEVCEVELPDLMVSTKVDDMVQDVAMRMQQSGLTLEQYMQFTGSTPESMREEMTESAKKNLKSSLCIEAVADKEDIQATEEEIDAEIQKMADQYGMKVEDVVKYFGEDERNNLKQNVRITKAIKFLVENAKLN